ncbi:hypothetical protein RRG08_008708 [Elysia crispata]|uniref:Uncharacterized protein n=1 Tax=Elysia crispata TaxID=231223 RepID=A0AAE0XQZ5_9GAST|nr:hypothetical protein RRG08_008708 [Elysia crispata]
MLGFVFASNSSWDDLAMKSAGIKAQAASSTQSCTISGATRVSERQIRLELNKTGVSSRVSCTVEYNAVEKSCAPDDMLRGADFRGRND